MWPASDGSGPPAAGFKAPSSFTIQENRPSAIMKVCSDDWRARRRERNDCTEHDLLLRHLKALSDRLANHRDREVNLQAPSRRSEIKRRVPSFKTSPGEWARARSTSQPLLLCQRRLDAKAPDRKAAPAILQKELPTSKCALLAGQASGQRTKPMPGQRTILLSGDGPRTSSPARVR